MRSFVSLTLCASLAAGLSSAATAPEYRRLERAYWAFQRPAPAPPPAVAAEFAAWVKTPVDAFVAAKLAEAELRPAAEADRATLIRRAYFNVTGLPPSPAEVADFLADRSANAWEKVVDRLLESPHYGERWGQHWLDVVRFAETEGFEYDRYLPGLWRYRDYVIQSFNKDKPYDQFLREQLAGDEMVEGEATSERNQELLVAAGFHRLGAVRRNAGNQEVASSRNEVLTERTDIVGSAFLAASEERDVPLGGAMSPEEWRDKTKDLRGKLKNMRGKMQFLEGEELQKLEQEYAKLEADLPPAPENITTVTNDYANRTPIHVLARGEFENKGERVDMRPLGVLLPEGAEATPADTENPRLILANWFADPKHPLTSRVIVNRIWSFHFGKGIVNTPNDFGFMGDRPSHPELLDYLAAQLEENGWRMKAIHKMVLMSSAFRQASENPAFQEAGMAKDADNRLLWHAPMRRLSAEEVRDAMLTVSGKLNTKMYGESVIIPVDQTLVDLLYDPTQWDVTKDKNEHYRRSVYLIAKRNLRLPFMEVFDQPAAQTTCARRESSTHAPQSLELLNGTISNDLAEHFAARIVSEVGNVPEQQVERAYLLAANRMPTDAEKRIGVSFLAEQPLREFALAMFNLNAFLYLQ